MQDTAPPSAHVQTLLALAADAVADLRRAWSAAAESVDALRTSGAAAETGHRSTARLLEEHLRLNPRHAATLLRRAALITPQPGLSDGHDVDPVLPATATGLRDGDLDPEHLAVIATAMRTVSRLAHLPIEVVDETERQLAALARIRTPAQLTADAAEILLRLDPDGQLTPDADRPVQHLQLSTGRDGSLRGTFRYADPDAAETLRTAIDALTPPPDPEDTEAPGRQSGRSLPERHAAALLDLAEDHLGLHPDDRSDHDPFDHDPFGHDPFGHDPFHEGRFDDGRFDDTDDDTVDHLVDDTDRPFDARPDPTAPTLEAGPGTDATTLRARPPRTQGGDAVHLTVTVPLEVLEDRARERASFGLLDGQYAITPETARRLACDAAVIPAVLGSRSEILDVGRKTRVVTNAQRRALILRDRHCAHPGCRRRPRRCRAHHVVPWALGGPTDIDNLVLICAYHHHLIHHSGWSIHMRDGLPVFIPPAWLDPLQRPRSNHHHAPAS